jgi:hypothetical protein
MGDGKLVGCVDMGELRSELEVGAWQRRLR